MNWGRRRFLCEVATLMRTIVEGPGGCELLKHKVESRCLSMQMAPMPPTRSDDALIAQ